MFQDSKSVAKAERTRTSENAKHETKNTFRVFWRPCALDENRKHRFAKRCFAKQTVLDLRNKCFAFRETLSYRLRRAADRTARKLVSEQLFLFRTWFLFSCVRVH